MIRTAVYFGLWATICMALAITGFFAMLDFPDNGKLTDLGETLPLITFFAVFSPIAGIVAGLGWMLFHGKGRQPALWGYALLAIGVVVVSHVLVFGGLNIGWWWPDLPGWVGTMSILFMMHAWLSVPVALVATTLFVLWNRRRAASA